MKIFLTTFLLFMLLWGIPAHAVEPYHDRAFPQEYHQIFQISGKDNLNACAVVVTNDNRVWAAAEDGLYVLAKDEQIWKPYANEKITGPLFSLIADSTDNIWVGAWNGLLHISGDQVRKMPVCGIITAMTFHQNSLYAAGPDGFWQITNDKVEQLDMPFSRSVKSLLSDKKGGLWISTANGLYYSSPSQFYIIQDPDILPSLNVSEAVYDTNGKLWVACLGGIGVLNHAQPVQMYTTKDGLPGVYLNCVAKAPDGKIWIGTDKGVVQTDGKDWSLRHSRRWLLSDDVRDIAFDKQSTAWIATSKGVSAIKTKNMTLADKDQFFHRICMARHRREPGLIEKCRLTTPGDTTSWQPMDDDNDGQYTGMYLVMESYRFAATQDPQARLNAQNAYNALEHLQHVTQTDGFVARTVIPKDWNRMGDPNRTYTPQQWAKSRVENPRDKKVESLWRSSKDGKWLWKGDTSSDEMTGHMYGYLFYYDLVADKTEKKRISKHVCAIMDYIIDNGYVLTDIDGTHTQWGVWSPEKLNHDPDWQAERGINSIEILSYLKLAYHVSGDEKYQREYNKLLYKENYIVNILIAKRTNPAWRTHIDDELLALAYPCLLLYEDDPALRELYEKSFEMWYENVKYDNSPFFEFTYGAFKGKLPRFQKAIEFLIDTPLDLVRWQIDNSQREDINLVRFPEMENLQLNRMFTHQRTQFFSLGQESLECYSR